VPIGRARILVCQPATVSVRRTRAERHGLAALRREFPTVAVEVEAGGGDSATLATIDLAAWTDRTADFAPFDRHVDDLARLGPVTIVVHGEASLAVRAAGEMLTRWQRLVGRRNEASSRAEFDALLSRFEALHDVRKPLVRADWNHALDTWQWMLRLDPGARAAAQAAALLHDVERLESEADARIEHLAASYEAFKQRHAERGSRIARGLLEACGFDAPTVERACSLVAGHELPDDDPDRKLLADADALSFFSQNSSGYLDYFGPEATIKKIAYSLRRMRASAVSRLASVRLRADVERLVDDVRLGRASGRARAELEAHARGKVSA